MSHSHHPITPALPSTAAATLGHSPGLAIVLTVIFGAVAVVFILLLLRFGIAKTSHRHGTASRPSARTAHGLEAIGAAVMALMFATMSV